VEFDVGNGGYTLGEKELHSCGKLTKGKNIFIAYSLEEKVVRFKNERKAREKARCI